MPAFDTPEPIILDIDMYVGLVRLHAGDRTDTVVDVRPSDPSVEASVQVAERTVVEFSGGRLLVKGPRPKALGHLLPWRGSIDVTVDLPAGSRVEAKAAAEIIATGVLGETVVHSMNGDLRLEETGPLEAKTSNGHIFVERVTGPAEATTSNGAVRIGYLDGPGTAKSSNGAIAFGEAAGDLQVKTASGDVTIGRATAGLTAKTAFGRIQVGEVVRGTVRLESGHGKISAGIAEGTAAWLDLNSKFGVVRSSLTAAEGPESTDTVAEVHAHTNYGDIDVHRS
ncbi:DUF4097 family beta strand repeat-containing protein [Actinomadura violacea]|uniref:DUF4097 family beta strand repeat protein n=1 Tax=Actinomadura violacea TaxID=2819934 RepID=A0ABS3RVZ5_9ACTN|nr:DUF4097 family beta strand repeat-containing protein [Actinomadura violacea]MBO2460934.1 DUF4097 family beta strand repeat protein [Actinomadura violacea]